MKVVTFNIKCDSRGHAPDSPLGRNTFAARQEMIKARIRREDPDILGFQETQPHMIKWLRENLPEYIFMGHGREKDFSGETMLLAVKRDKFELWGFETFWLSPEPFTPGSRFEEQSTCPRTCAVALLKCGEFDFPFRVYLTHLDHQGAGARRLGLAQILRHMDEDNTRLSAPCILMGDMNAKPGAPEFSPLEDHPGLIDLTGDVGDTFHNFGEGPLEKIDYIFVSKPLKGSGARRWHEEHDGIYLSDHDPVSVELKVNE